ncbi:MAG: GNAT family N-acetyltransferase [Emcibacter sp.]|nr:GNAT family N-acetyltransferase [Emcibacter sp.]
MSSLTIRAGTVNDVPVILSFIIGLAEYENLSHEVVATEASLKESLFCDQPIAHVIIGEVNEVPSGFALYFYNYSSFLSRKGIYLEDLFVNSDRRGCGLGKALLLHLAHKAYEEGCGRMEWAVLNWNKPSIEFYQSLGAKAQDGWTGYRLDHSDLSALQTRIK